LKKLIFYLLKIEKNVKNIENCLKVNTTLYDITLNCDTNLCKKEVVPTLNNQTKEIKYVPMYTIK
jgi:hypothetical protein